MGNKTTGNKNKYVNLDHLPGVIVPSISSPVFLYNGLYRLFLCCKYIKPRKERPYSIFLSDVIGARTKTFFAAHWELFGVHKIPKELPTYGHTLKFTFIWLDINILGSDTLFIVSSSDNIWINLRISKHNQTKIKSMGSDLLFLFLFFLRGRPWFFYKLIPKKVFKNS